jgi:hypothetical protein
MTEEPPKPKKERSDKQKAHDAILREQGKEWGAMMKARSEARKQSKGKESETNAQRNENESKPASQTTGNESGTNTQTKPTESPHPSLPPPPKEEPAPPKKKPYVFGLRW